MAKPAILTVDDEPAVLRAIASDLRREYGNRYRIVAADSGSKALESLNQLKERNESVALLLADQRMPQLNGVDFLEQGLKIFPRAKRALLTAYADTDAAIQAINSVRVDYYLMKPWDPPEERLYPVLNDLLEDWQATYRPQFDGIRVIGHRWSPRSHLIKDFLAGNQVPFQWLDIEVEEEGRKAVENVSAKCALEPDSLQLPLVILPDGDCLQDPTSTQLAERIGMRIHANNPFYDLIIVGGGPAGLAAGVYGASEGLETMMIERQAPGGQAGTSSRIENYLGFPAGLSGADLARRAVTQARRFGVEILTTEVTGLRIDGAYRLVKIADGSELSCHALLIATGVAWRRLDVPGMDRLTGAGVYYGAAMTEASSCSGEDVYLVGGANSAGQAAIYFAKYARKVVMLLRGDSLTKSMSNYLIKEIEATSNIEVQPYTSVMEAHGETSLDSISVVNHTSGVTETFPTRSLFIFIGAMPHTDWLSGVVQRDDLGFILSGRDLVSADTGNGNRRPKGWTLDRDPYMLETSIPGVFVAGDVRHGSIKRVASSVGEGSIAIQFVHQYLSKV